MPHVRGGADVLVTTPAINTWYTGESRSLHTFEKIGISGYSTPVAGEMRLEVSPDNSTWLVHILEPLLPIDEKSVVIEAPLYPFVRFSARATAAGGVTLLGRVYGISRK